MHEKRHRVAGVLRVGGVFEIAVIAGQDQRVGCRVELVDKNPEEPIELPE